MAASPSIDVSPKLLRTLHRIHQQRADLQGQLRRIPMQLTAIQSTVEEAQAAVDAAAAALKKARMTADEKQLQLQSREAHVAELQRKLNTAASNKEFSMLKDQIAADEQANNVQNDEIFEVLERIDTLESQLQEANKQLDETRQEADKKKQATEDRLATVESNLERVEGQLKAAEADLPSAAISDYKRITAARGEDALAPIEEDSCGGCSQTLTAQLIDQVRLAKLARCPNCNAFLYEAEDRRVR